MAQIVALEFNFLVEESFCRRKTSLVNLPIEAILAELCLLEHMCSRTGRILFCSAQLSTILVSLTY